MARSEVYKWKVSASLDGQDKLLQALLARASHEQRIVAHEAIAKRIRTEARRLVPRKTGELQRAIQVFYEGDLAVGVGVPADSPAIAKAWATEYGSWNYSVGTPETPKTEWKTKSKPEAAMPWLRTAVLVRRMSILRALRRQFLTGKRPRGPSNDS